MTLKGMERDNARKHLKEKAIPLLIKRLEKPLEIEDKLIYTKLSWKPTDSHEQRIFP
jgi:hypothetical protein